MAPDVVARVFDPYFTTKARGRGLGLATSIGILRRHGGAIRVRSELGRGTAFEVLLPVANHAVADVVPPPPPTAEVPPGATILLVDDDDAIRRLASRILDRSGFRTLVAGSGDEALELLRAQQVEAVILDSTMPGEDGAAIAQRIRAVLPAIPILRSSGFQAEELPQTEPFLPKPYTSEQLVDAVRALFA